MGWKSFKYKFGIEHHVQIVSGKLLIGSGYVSSIVSIDLKTGTVSENPTFRGFLKEEYPQLFKATKEEILQPLSEPDCFAKSSSVFTYDRDQIIEKNAEELGWPNVTHDGVMMYDNLFFATSAEAVAKAKSDNLNELQYSEESLLDHEAKVTRIQNKIVELKEIQKNLERGLK